MNHILQSSAVLSDPVKAVGQLVGLAILAAALAGVVALAYRWYVRERIQEGLPVLLGLGGVAIYLNTTTALGQVIGAQSQSVALPTTAALYNITAFLIGGFAASGGMRVGDRLGMTVFAATSRRDIEGDVSRVVEAVGRVISVQIPDEIDDIVGYDPIPGETKDKLAGRTFLFPRRLTVAELESRLQTRLKADYGVGHVDIEITKGGDIEYIALGSRAAGIGPTLPPETAAVAVRADPAFAASAGDIVQVWTTDPMERVTTAELRGVAGDVVTLAIDAADTPKLDADTEYKLVTLPVETRPDREFASLLRAAEETMSLVEVQDGSVLVGQPVGSLGVTVIAIRAAGAENGIEAIPTRERVLTPGDCLYTVAKPDELRKLEAAAASLNVADTTPADKDKQSEADD